MGSFPTKVKWCGRTIDADGYQMDSLYIEALRNVNFSVMGDNLSLFFIEADGFPVVSRNFT